MKEQLKKVKEFLENKFNIKLSMEQIEIKLEEMTLIDGITKVSAEKFEAGQSISLVLEDGTMQPLPIGEYDLEDGRVIVVVEDGFISEVRDVAQEEAPAPTEEQPVQASTEAPASREPKRVVESVVKESHFSENESLKSEIEELKKQVAELMEQKKTVELSEETETVKPIVFNPESAKVETVKIGNGNTPESNILARVYGIK